MSLKDLFAELRRREVLKVAVAYIATGIVVLEVVTHLFHNFEAPRWVLKVFTSLLIIGFPVAGLMAWGFEFKDGSIHANPPASAEARDTAPEQRRPVLLFVGLLLIALLAGVALAQWRAQVPTTGGKQVTPILLQKETVGATWAREDQILKETPNLVLVHRPSFYHSMNRDFGFGYASEPGVDEARAKTLHEISQNKIVAFLGYVGQMSPDTLFVVYGRGTGGDWEDVRDRARSVAQAEGRFPGHPDHRGTRTARTISLCGRDRAVSAVSRSAMRVAPRFRR